MHTVCVQCEAEFRTEDAAAALCPRCQRLDDQVYANDPTPSVEPPLRPYARRSMQARLGVTGDVDA